MGTHGFLRESYSNPHPKLPQHSLMAFLPTAFSSSAPWKLSMLSAGPDPSVFPFIPQTLSTGDILTSRPPISNPAEIPDQHCLIASVEHWEQHLHSRILMPTMPHLRAQENTPTTTGTLPGAQCIPPAPTQPLISAPIADPTAVPSHRITEWPGLGMEGTSRLMHFQPPCHMQGLLIYSWSLSLPPGLIKDVLC